MAGFFVRMDENLRGRPEVLQVADVTGRSPEDVIGHLHSLWRWVQREAEAPGLIRGVGLSALIHECHGDETLWRALAGTEWITFDQAGIRVKNWEDRFSDVAQRRADDAQRKRTKRATEKARDADDDLPAPANASPPIDQSSSPPLSPETNSDKGGVFEHLTAEHLGQTGSMIEWIEWQALHRSRIVDATDETYRLILAAARFALNDRCKNPIAYFKWIVGKRRWDAIPQAYYSDACKRLALDETMRKRREEARRKAFESHGGGHRQLTKQEQADHLRLRFDIPRTA